MDVEHLGTRWAVFIDGTMATALGMHAQATDAAVAAQQHLQQLAQAAPQLAAALALPRPAGAPCPQLGGAQ